MEQTFSNFDNIKKVLILGYGSIGKRHARIIKENWPSIRLAALRSNPQNVNRSDYDLLEKNFTSIDDAISWKPSVAIICSPSSEHLTQSSSLTNHHIPLLIEKPLGTGFEDLDQWDDLIKKSKTMPILVGYVLRYDPCFVFIQNILKTNVIGKIIHVDAYCGSWLPDWRPNIDYRLTASASRSLGGGVLTELSHEIDFLKSLFPSLELMFSSISSSELLQIDVEDQACLFCRSKECSNISIRLDFCTLNPKREVVFRGSKGEISWNIITSTVHQITEHGKQVYQPDNRYDNRYKLQLHNLFASVLGTESPKSSVLEAVNVLKIIKSARNVSI